MNKGPPAVPTPYHPAGAGEDVPVYYSAGEKMEGEGAEEEEGDFESRPPPAPPPP